MTRSKTLFALLVVALLATLVAPAGAARSSASARAQRDAARAKKAKLATELNTLRAGEKQLLSAARALNDQVLAQAARVDAARQAVKAANIEVAESDAALKETKASISRLHDLLVERAVAAFISPDRSDDRSGLGGDTTDLAVAARKQALLDTVSANDDDLIDELNAAEEDYAIQLAAAQAAKAKAEARAKDAKARLTALEKARRDQQNMQVALDRRKREVLGEIDEQAKSESELSRIIATYSRPSTGGTTARNAGGCIWPARGRVTSEYGRRWGRLHAGIDIGAGTGSPIWAAKAGTVIFAGRQSGYGNVIIIDHGGGMTTLYGHQSRLLARRGQEVAQGTRIGSVGSTGHSTGPHLHFETRYGGSPRNPRGCLR